jgi:hypothetical protein
MRKAILLTLTLLAFGPAAARAQPTVHALAFPGAASPVLTELRHEMGRDMIVSRATRRRVVRQNRRYKLLIVDGDTMAPASLARHRRAIDRYLDGGGRVLALDMRPGHFARALNDLTGISVDPIGPSRHSSRAFMFRQAVVGGVPAVLILDATRLQPLGAARATRSARRKAVIDLAGRVAALIHARLRPHVGVPARPNVLTNTGDDGPPPEALHKMWYVESPSDGLPSGSTSPEAAYYQRNPTPPGITAPTAGNQTVSWTIAHQFDVYLDNSPSHPDGNYQLIAYNLNASVTPKRPDQKFTFMDDPFHVGADWKALERAWWTGIVDASVTPDQATGQELVWQANAPSTPNQEAEYSSGQTFEVGVSASMEGPAVSASYTISNEQKHDVPDWGVSSETAGNDLSWEFSSRENCDVRPYGAGNCFSGSDLTPVHPNALSTGELPVEASGLWKTKRLLEPGDGMVSFKLDTPVTLVDTVCDTWWIGTCKPANPDGRFVSTQKIGPPAATYSFDASDVVPVGIKSVTVSPSPADGGANQVVTGTITLSRPAPMRTTVKVFSDWENAVLPIPLNNGLSADSVTFAPGATTKTFEIDTNANDLPKGQHVTADITAFYAEPTDPVPLRIVHK